MEICRAVDQELAADLKPLAKPHHNRTVENPTRDCAPLSLHVARTTIRIPHRQ